MRKEIIIDNDTKKVVNENLYIEKKKSKSKKNLYITSLVLLVVIIGLSWSFFHLYSSIKESNFIKGSWECSNKLKMNFSNNTYEFNNPSNNYNEKGNYTISKVKTEDNNYYILELVNNEKEIIGKYSIATNENKDNFIISDYSENLELNCKKIS